MNLQGALGRPLRAPTPSLPASSVGRRMTSPSLLFSPFPLLRLKTWDSSAVRV